MTGTYEFVQGLLSKHGLTVEPGRSEPFLVAPGPYILFGNTPIAWPAHRKRRPPRRETKQKNAWAKRARNQLVRLAGWKTKEPYLRLARIEHFQEYDGPPVSVPRSLRPILGRWIGGTK
jgi:hypothetical protein